jgi:D-alanyl-D-alanine carboxypeptidase
VQAGLDTGEGGLRSRERRALRSDGHGSRMKETFAWVVWVLALAPALVGFSGVGAARAAESADSAVAGQDSLLAARLQSLLDDLVEREPGVRSGLLLVDGPTFHWKGASGVAFAECQDSALPDDQFDIDSIAKMMTATIAMKLVEEGRLELDDRVAEYLPESLVDRLHVFEGRSFSHEVTVRELLNHTSGIVDDWACPGFLDLVAGDSERRWSPEETIEYVKENCPPRFPPGGGWHYSDTGYNILGLILEAVAEKPLHAVYREMLLDPLGMEHTYRPAYEPARPVTPGRPPAERYLGDLECGLWTSVMTADWAGGGLVSTTEDLNRFLRAFVRGDVFADSLTKGEMLTWVESGPRNNYGLGVSRVLFSRFDDPLVSPDNSRI